MRAIEAAGSSAWLAHSVTQQPSSNQYSRWSLPRTCFIASTPRRPDPIMPPGPRREAGMTSGPWCLHKALGTLDGLWSFQESVLRYALILLCALPFVPLQLQAAELRQPLPDVYAIVDVRAVTVPGSVV